MRIPAILTGLFLCTAVVAVQNTQVSAESVQQLLPENSTSLATELAVLEVVEQKLEKPPVEPAPPKEHVVASGETLTAVAEEHETTWQRLYAKNTELAHPDVIEIGHKVTIPLPDEQLTERPLPEPPAQPQAPVPQPTKSTESPKPITHVSRGTASGNTYAYGYCTWYVKNKRPDLPNNLGNADTWVSRARAQGLPTGSTPVAGAVGQQGMHVVYVEKLNSDGTVTVSEMNYEGFNVVSSRTVAASNFQYIY